MIIDMHVHIFPDEIAEKAAGSISKFYGIPMNADGRLSTLMAIERAAGVDKIVLCSAATTARQTEHINDYTAQIVGEHPGTLYGLGAMHQDHQKKADEVRRIDALGLRGVKIHPDIQGVQINDRRFDEMYAALEEMGMPVLAHTGDKRYDNSNPDRVIDVLTRFPRLTMVGAHFGCWSLREEGVKALARFDRFYVDCSSSLYALSPQKAREIIHAYGADRVMFGSDFPMWKADEELKLLRRVGLTEDEMEKVLCKNAQAVFAIE